MFTHAVVFVMAVSLAGIGGFYSGVFFFFLLFSSGVLFINHSQAWQAESDMTKRWNGFEAARA
jgi:hypothetical protein